MELKELENKIAQLEAANKAAIAERDAVKKNLDSATSDVTKLKTQNAELVTELKNTKEEAATEIERLSAELTASQKDAAASILIVNLKSGRYTTPAGRIYNIDGVDTKAEDLVKNKELCQRLVDIDSHILTKSV